MILFRRQWKGLIALAAASDLEVRHTFVVDFRGEEKFSRIVAE
jgi:hypothetical protein